MFVPHRSRSVAFAALAGLVALTLTPLSTATAATGLATDVVVSGHQTTASSTVVSPVFSTTQSGELLLAFVTADGPAVAGSETFPSVTGAGLTWQLRKRVNAQYGTAEIWQAVSSSVITNATVTATHGGSALAAITVVGFTGADTATAGAVAGASGASGAPSTTLTTTRTGSWVWGVGEDWDNAAARTVGSGHRGRPSPARRARAGLHSRRPSARR